MSNVEVEVGGQVFPPKRPTIIRPVSGYQTAGDRHGPSVPERPGFPPLTSRPLPPLPTQKPAAHLDSHANGQALSHNKSQQLADLHRKPATNKTKGSERKHPEITVVCARPMSEVGFRNGKLDSSRALTPPPTIADQSELYKTGDDGGSSDGLSSSQMYSIPSRPRSPLPSRSKSPVPSRPKMPLPSRPKPEVPEDSATGGQSHHTLADQVSLAISDPVRKEDISSKAFVQQKPKRPTIIRPPPRPASTALVSSHSQVSTNAPIAAPRPKPRPRSVKYKTDSDLLSEASEHLDLKKSYCDDLQTNQIVPSLKETPPQRPASSLKMLKKVSNFEEGSSTTSMESDVQPQPLPSRMDVNSDYDSQAFKNEVETASSTCKTAEPPPRPPPSPKMSIGRKPTVTTVGRPTPASKPKPAVLPKPKPPVKPSVPQKEKTDAKEWEIIKDNDIKSIEPRGSVVGKAPPKPPRAVPIGSDAVSVTVLDSTSNPDNEGLNRSSRARPPLPKRRSISIDNMFQKSASDKSTENNSEIKEKFQNRNDNNHEQKLLRRKSSDSETETTRRTSLTSHREKPPLPKRHSIDVSPMLAINRKPRMHSHSVSGDESLLDDNKKSSDSNRNVFLPGSKPVLPSNFTNDIQEAINAQKASSAHDDRSSRGILSLKGKQSFDMNDKVGETALIEPEKINSKSAPPLPKRKFLPVSDEGSNNTELISEKPDTLSSTNRSVCMNSNMRPSLGRTNLGVQSSSFDSNQQSTESSQSFTRNGISKDEQKKYKTTSPVSCPPLPSKAPSASKRSPEVSISSKSDEENSHLIEDSPLQDLDRSKSESKCIDRKEFLLVKPFAEPVTKLSNTSQILPIPKMFSCSDTIIQLPVDDETNDVSNSFGSSAIVSMHEIADDLGMEPAFEDTHTVVELDLLHVTPFSVSTVTNNSMKSVNNNDLQSMPQQLSNYDDEYKVVSPALERSLDTDMLQKKLLMAVELLPVAQRSFSMDEAPSLLLSEHEVPILSERQYNADEFRSLNEVPTASDRFSSTDEVPVHPGTEFCSTEASSVSQISLDLDEFEGIDLTDFDVDEAFFQCEQRNGLNETFSETLASIPDIHMPLAADNMLPELNIILEPDKGHFLNEAHSSTDETHSASDYSISSDDTLVPESSSIADEICLSEKSDNEYSEAQDPCNSGAISVVKFPPAQQLAPKSAGSLSSQRSNTEEENYPLNGPSEMLKSEDEQIIVQTSTCRSTTDGYQYVQDEKDTEEVCQYADNGACVLSHNLSVNDKLSSDDSKRASCFDGDKFDQLSLEKIVDESQCDTYDNEMAHDEIQNMSDAPYAIDKIRASWESADGQIIMSVSSLINDEQTMTCQNRYSQIIHRQPSDALYSSLATSEKVIDNTDEQVSDSVLIGVRETQFSKLRPREAPDSQAVMPVSSVLHSQHNPCQSSDELYSSLATSEKLIDNTDIQFLDSVLVDVGETHFSELEPCDRSDEQISTRVKDLGSHSSVRMTWQSFSIDEKQQSPISDVSQYLFSPDMINRPFFESESKFIQQKPNTDNKMYNNLVPFPVPLDNRSRAEEIQMSWFRNDMKIPRLDTLNIDDEFYSLPQRSTSIDSHQSRLPRLMRIDDYYPRLQRSAKIDENKIFHVSPSEKNLNGFFAGELKASSQIPVKNVSHLESIDPFCEPSVELPSNMSEAQSQLQIAKRSRFVCDSAISFDEIQYQSLKSESINDHCMFHHGQTRLEKSLSSDETKPLQEMFDTGYLDHLLPRSFEFTNSETDNNSQPLAILDSSNDIQSFSMENTKTYPEVSSEIQNNRICMESGTKQDNLVPHLLDSGLQTGCDKQSFFILDSSNGIQELHDPNIVSSVEKDNKIVMKSAVKQDDQFQQQETSDPLYQAIPVSHETFQNVVVALSSDIKSSDMPLSPASALHEAEMQPAFIFEFDKEVSPKRQKPPLPLRAPSSLPSSPDDVLLLKRKSSRRLSSTPKHRSLSTGDMVLPVQTSASLDGGHPHFERSFCNEPITEHSVLTEKCQDSNVRPPRPKKLPRTSSLRLSTCRLPSTGEKLTSAHGKKPLCSRSGSMPVMLPQVSGEFGTVKGEGRKPVRPPRKLPSLSVPSKEKNDEEGVVQLRPSRPKAGPPRPMSMPVKSHTTGNLSVFEGKSEKPDKPRPPKPSSNKVDSLGTPILPQRPLPGHPLYHYMVEGPKGVALFDYESNQPDELHFKTGEIITLVKRIDPSWLMGEISERQGIFPQNFIDVLEPLPNKGDHVTEETVDTQSTVEKPDLIAHGPRCRARFDFDSDGADDLTFEEGDVIRIIDHIGEDWLRGEFSGGNGIFPISFVEIIEDLPAGNVKQKTDTISADDKIATALFDFEGKEELKFLAGDKITVLGQMNMEWLYGEVNAVKGLFPSTFVDRVPSGLPEYQPMKVETQQAIAVTDKPHCTALFDYHGENSDDLQFETGQKIELLAHINTDWLRGRTNEQEGVFPASFVQIERDIPEKEPETLQIGKAMYDFLGENENELTFKVGDNVILQELLEGDADWRWGDMNGKRGIFPSSFVEAVMQ